MQLGGWLSASEQASFTFHSFGTGRFPAMPKMRLSGNPSTLQWLKPLQSLAFFKHHTMLNFTL